jgi:hypothetical protein
MHRQDVGCLLRGRIFAETIRRLRFLITVGYKKSGFVSRPPRGFVYHVSSHFASTQIFCVSEFVLQVSLAFHRFAVSE